MQDRSTLPAADHGGDAPLSRTAATEAVHDIGWRYLLGTLCVWVPVRSLAHAGEVATAAVAVCGPAADSHLRVTDRDDRDQRDDRAP